MMFDNFNVMPVYHVETPRPFIRPLTLYGHASDKFPVISRNLQHLSKNPITYRTFTGCMPMRGGEGRGAIVHMSGGVALLYILHRENKIFVVTVLLKHLTYPVGLTLPITPCLCNAATGTLIMCFLK